MMKLQTLFKNHFRNPKLSFNDLKKFSEDHLARITVNDRDDKLKHLLSSTGVAHTAYFGALSDKDVAAAVKEGMTVAVDQTIDNFKAMVRRKASAVENAFGAGSPKYQEFFPHGLSEYSNATKANVETLMRRMVTSGLMNETELGGDFSNAFSTVYNEYQNIREAQLGKKGEVDNLGNTRDEARMALTTQLTANLHYIAYLYPGDVTKCMSYFDATILQDDAPDEPEAPHETA